MEIQAQVQDRGQRTFLKALNQGSMSVNRCEDSSCSSLSSASLSFPKPFLTDHGTFRNGDEKGLTITETLEQ